MEDIIVIKRVGIIGMGALGMLYGDFIAKNITREAVTFIVDEKSISGNCIYNKWWESFI